MEISFHEFLAFLVIFDILVKVCADSPEQVFGFEELLMGFFFGVIALFSNMSFFIGFGVFAEPIDWLRFLISDWTAFLG